MKSRIIKISLVLILVASCTKRVPLVVMEPAKISTNQIHKVALGPLSLEGIQIVEYDATTGKRWKRKVIQLSRSEKKALSRQVRARVVNALTETPYFQLVYLDEFKALRSDQDLQKLVAAAGFRVKKVDAVITGKYWIDIEKNRGIEPDTVHLRYVQGGQRNVVLDFEPIVWWPYSSLRGNMVLQIKLTSLNPLETLADRSYTRSYGYKVSARPATVSKMGQEMAREKVPQETGQKTSFTAQILPSLEQVIQDLADSSAKAFVREVAVTQKTVYYPMDDDGDEVGLGMLQSGDYELAITYLQKLTAEEPSPADLYNLALCYEAVGEYGLARGTYQDAWKLTPDNKLYATGIGRIEKLLRQHPSLRDQLFEKGRKK